MAFHLYSWQYLTYIPSMKVNLTFYSNDCSSSDPVNSVTLSFYFYLFALLCNFVILCNFLGIKLKQLSDELFPFSLKRETLLINKEHGIFAPKLSMGWGWEFIFLYLQVESTSHLSEEVSLSSSFLQQIHPEKPSTLHPFHHLCERAVCKQDSQF